MYIANGYDLVMNYFLLGGCVYSKSNAFLGSPGLRYNRAAYSSVKSLGLLINLGSEARVLNVTLHMKMSYSMKRHTVLNLVMKLLFFVCHLVGCSVDHCFNKCPVN